MKMYRRGEFIHVKQGKYHLEINWYRLYMNFDVKINEGIINRFYGIFPFSHRKQWIPF